MKTAPLLASSAAYTVSPSLGARREEQLVTYTQLVELTACNIYTGSAPGEK